MPLTQNAWNLSFTYLSLPPRFYKLQNPIQAKNPELLIYNQDLASELHIPELETIEKSKIFSGSKIPEGATPFSQAYAGHQFGNFTMLGDGRAVVLGEILDSKGNRLDLQWKGSGRTPFSRGGDGRATIRSMLREYLMSESMHGLGIPTTRSLAVTKTGEIVLRETAKPGGVLVRVAQSHIRVGTFEYAYHFLQEEELEKLLQYTVERHYPEISSKKDLALAFFDDAMLRQISLVTHWMRVGFIHGVMNTDNMSLAGETIDYGPCSFVNAYDPKTVFSSIDTQGRYAFGNQARIAHWNLACLANCLLPFFDKDEEKSISIAKEKLDEFPELWENSYRKMLGKKIGIPDLQKSDTNLVQNLLDWMQSQKADYTNTFLALEYEPSELPEVFKEDRFLSWKRNWKNKLSDLGISWEIAKKTMQQSNPFRIPRNHIVESLLDEAEEGNLENFQKFILESKKPYARLDDSFWDWEPLPGYDSQYRTFCGT